MKEESEGGMEGVSEVREIKSEIRKFSVDESSFPFLHLFVRL